MLRPRSGQTLIEVIIATTVGAVVIGLGAMLGFRHQRFHRDVVIAVERAERLEQVVALMPVALRAIAPGEGDIRAGGARDTALEFRATIASGVVCDSGRSLVVLAPTTTEPVLSSMLSRPESGDTAWSLDTRTQPERWVPHPVTAVIDTSSTCMLGQVAPFGLSRRSSLALRIAGALPAPGSPVRITRPWRYSLYRASDNAWYLGAKEWNATLGRFNTIQPVAGPFMSAAGGGLRFQYFDSLGNIVQSGSNDTRRIARIEVGIRVDSVVPGNYDHALSVRGRSTAVIALRNRGR